MLRSAATRQVTAARLAAVCAIVLALGAGTAAARAPGEADRAEVTRLTNQLVDLTRKGEHDRAADLVPPRLVEAFAKKAGISVETFTTELREQSKRIAGLAKVESFDADIEHAEARETKTGEPYFLIPTRSVLDAGPKGRLEDEGTLLAVYEAGRWWLVRLNVKQLAVLRETYPGLQGVPFPEGSVRVLKP